MAFGTTQDLHLAGTDDRGRVWKRKLYCPGKYAVKEPEESAIPSGELSWLVAPFKSGFQVLCTFFSKRLELD